MADEHRNFAYSTVVVAPVPPTTGAALTIVTGDGAGFPPAPFNITVSPFGLLPTRQNAEILRVTGIAGDVFTCLREQEGTTARTIIEGDQVAATITAKTLQDVEATAFPPTGVTGKLLMPGAVVVGASTPQAVEGVPTFVIDPTAHIMSGSRQPRCALYQSGQQTIPTATWSYVLFDTEDFNVGSMHVAGQPRITIPPGGAGIYLVHMDLTFAGNTTGDRGAGLQKNGVTTTRIHLQQGQWSVSGGQSLAITDLVPLVPGDTLSGVAYQSSGANLVIGFVGSHFANRLWAVKLW